MRLLLALFILRILVLLVSTYINLHVVAVSDSVNFNLFGVEEYHLLFKNPQEYFVNIFHANSPQAYSRFLDDSHSYWNNLRTNLLIKMLSIFDLFSFGNFLINTLFYNFLVFFGFVALYRVFIKIFPAATYQLIIAIFLLPSALFFTSMIHRDGLILLSLAMIIFNIFFLANVGFSVKRLAAALFFLLLVILLRNFVFIALVPALTAWLVSMKFPKYAFRLFAAVYAISAVLFFTSGYISPRANLPQYVTSRQESFIEIGKAGNSTIPIDALSPNFKGFVSNAPQALNHAVLRPYLTEIVNLQYLPFAMEVLMLELLLIVFLIFHKRHVVVNPLIYFGIFFSMTMLLMAGYTVPIIGAIVRYRSIYLIFLTVPLFCYTDWRRIRNFLVKKPT